MIARVAPRIVAVDPGSESSGVVLYDPVCSEPVVYAAKVENDHLLAWLHAKAIPYDVAGWHHLTGFHVFVVEFPHARGMPASNDLFRTVWWVGRFAEAWGNHEAYVEIDRKDVKIAMCGVGNAKDSNIRAALIDRFGGKDRAIGCKRAPGPLYGVKADAWSALALAVTYAERGASSDNNPRPAVPGHREEQ